MVSLPGLRAHARTFTQTTHTHTCTARACESVLQSIDLALFPGSPLGRFHVQRVRTPDARSCSNPFLFLPILARDNALLYWRPLYMCSVYFLRSLA
eukprot:m.41809 g.41809  ORF g.41809 m.41809 type:complete len:96 (+) comp46255_c0_seq1:1-288(+)